MSTRLQRGTATTGVAAVAVLMIGASLVLAGPARGAATARKISEIRMWARGRTAVVSVNFDRAPRRAVELFVGGDGRSYGGFAMNVTKHRHVIVGHVGRGAHRRRFVVGRRYKVLISQCLGGPAAAQNPSPVAHAAKGGYDCRFARRSVVMEPLAPQPLDTPRSARRSGVKIDSLRLSLGAKQRVTVRIRFDRVPHGLTQVDVGGDGSSYLGYVVTGGVLARTFRGSYRANHITAGASLRVLVVLCRPPEKASQAATRRPPVAHAAKGNCSYIEATAVLLPGL